MATKGKKKVAKRSTRKSAASAAPSSAAAAASPETVSVLVNGHASGTVPSSATVEATLRDVLRNHGLKAAMVKINGQKIESPDLTRTLAQYKATSVDFVSKDTRG